MPEIAGTTVCPYTLPFKKNEIFNAKRNINNNNNNNNNSNQNNYQTNNDSNTNGYFKIYYNLHPYLYFVAFFCVCVFFKKKQTIATEIIKKKGKHLTKNGTSHIIRTNTTQ